MRVTHSPAMKLTLFSAVAAGAALTCVTSFRTPVVFPPLDVAKYIDGSGLHHQHRAHASAAFDSGSVVADSEAEDDDEWRGQTAQHGNEDAPSFDDLDALAAAAAELAVEGNGNDSLVPFPLMLANDGAQPEAEHEHSDAEWSTQDDRSGDANEDDNDSAALLSVSKNAVFETQSTAHLTKRERSQPTQIVADRLIAREGVQTFAKRLRQAAADIRSAADDSRRQNEALLATSEENQKTPLRFGTDDPFSLDNGSKLATVDKAVIKDDKHSGNSNDARQLGSSVESHKGANAKQRQVQRRRNPIAMAQRMTAAAAATRVKPPEHSLAVWDSDGTICILARLQAVFAIPYATAIGTSPAVATGSGGGLSAATAESVGRRQYATMKMPPNRELVTRGQCATDARDPLFEVQWPLFKMIMHFSRSRQRSSWYVNRIEVQYNTNSPLFPGALQPGRRYASTSGNVSLFMTPMGQSYGCPLHPPLALTIINSSARIMLKLKDVRLQAYQLVGGNYGPLSRCQQVAMAHTLDPYNYDRSVPVAVGSTLAGVSIATVAGYALYRSMFVRKVDYGTMSE